MLLPEKSFLVQRYAKLKFPQYSLIGYSMAGEETVVQVPELNVCFDVGATSRTSRSRLRASA